MEQYNIGDIIKETRERIGLCQEDLCGPEIAASTIYRIEAGLHVPQTRVIKFIFARMGMKVPINLVSVTEEEFKRYILQNDIEKKWINQEYDIINKLREFKRLNIEMDIFDIQFYLLYKAKYLLALKKDDLKTKKIAFKLLSKAILQTLPDFYSEKKLSKKKLLTQQEIDCIYEWSLLGYYFGNKEECENNIIYLLEYFQKKKNKENSGELFISRILMTLIQWEKEKNNIESILKYSEIGIEYCIKSSNVKLLADFLVFKSECLFDLKKNQEGEKLLKCAMYILEESGCNEKYEELRKILDNLVTKRKYR